MRRLKELYADVSGWLVRKYLRSTWIMALLRRHPRFAVVPGRGRPRLAVSYAEATRLLFQDRPFAVPYLSAMERLETRFVLGLPQSRDHTRQRRVLVSALATAPARVADASRASAARVLHGREGVEIVRELTDTVLQETVGAALGMGPLGPDQLDAARDVFRDIFINPFFVESVRARAAMQGGALNRHARHVFEERRAASDRGAPHRDDVLGRLVAMRANEPEDRLADEEIPQQLTGLFVAWVASVSRGMAYATDAILADPGARADAHEVAVAGDDEAMWRLIQKAFYATPPVPAIERHCQRADQVAGHRVPCERPVWIALTAALRDPVFETERERERRGDAHNLPFGFGMHQCIGIAVSKAQMSAIAIELFRRRDVRRASSLKLAGPYPNRLEVTFGAPA